MVNEFLISLLQTWQRAAFVIAKQLKTANEERPADFDEFNLFALTPESFCASQVPPLQRKESFHNLDNTLEHGEKRNN